MNISFLFKILCLLLITLTPSVVSAENPPNGHKNSPSTPPKTLTIKPNATEGYAQKMRQNPPPKINVNTTYNIEHIPYPPTN
ncbi:hypothetical protein GM3708_2927 [Geminocystis sp. NIES-3708]|uniref:hypothetical protein n=1 Tax=Geminocystis sp. NIES-3708 TaxID=1615909 RepID=UPI0005FC4E02|nr:hypothetical protein [Geminocystis sp. NIES-3708]BAQ62521.1 hypothetical protein GM3708_2927 [Geminocystis sp. NIES-3708]